MKSRITRRSRFRPILGAALLGGCLGGPSVARDVWVDPQGLGGTCDDAGSGGSAGTPLCTLGACLSQATGAGDRCLLRAGRYVGNPVPMADGAPGAPITVARYGDELVEIWGTVPLAGLWQADGQDVFSLTTTAPLPLALLESAPGGAELTYGPWVPASKRTWRPDRMAPRSFAWEPGEPVSTIRLRRPAGRGDPNASVWRARIADLDLRGRKSVAYEGIVFVDMIARLETATEVRFDDCRFVGVAEASSPAAHASDPLGPSPPLGTIGAPPTHEEVEIGDEENSGGDSPAVLGIADGGTGSNTSTGARMNLGAAWDGNVVHLTGGEIILGAKTFEAPVVIRDLNGVKRSSGFSNIAECVASLPPLGGVCLIDPDEDDTTPFVDANPDLRPYSLIRDTRRGGVRWLSSRPEPVSGATEDQVPFVFQVRWNDPTRSYDDDTGAIGEWNCGVDVPGAVDEWRNCPIGNVTRGSGSSTQPFWHTGQCNSNTASSSMRCGGPHILEVRYPDVLGSEPDKPVFAVGSGGASIYMPDFQDAYFQSALTIFRGRSSYFPTEMWNTPMYAFDKAGQFGDGGTFVGNSLSWPSPYTSHMYPPFNMWVQHDIASNLPAFVVEGTGEGTAQGERSPLAKFYDRSGKGTFVHPGTAREAFGFYSDSRLYLGSFRNSDGGGQVVEWEGRTLDANTVRLGVVNPTAPRTITLPDTDGYVAIAASGTAKITCGEVTIDPPLVAAGTTLVLTAAAPVVARSACACSPRGDWHDDLLLKSCGVVADGSLTVRLYNPDNASITDAATAPLAVDYCCTTK